MLDDAVTTRVLEASRLLVSDGHQMVTVCRRIIMSWLHNSVVWSAC